MRSFPNPPSSDSAQERKAAGENVVYLIRRPGYEFSLIAPWTGSDDLNGGGGSFQVRFRRRHGEHSGMLTFEQLEDFYVSLTNLMEYVNIEREKQRGACLPSRPPCSPTEGVTAETLPQSSQGVGR